MRVETSVLVFPDQVSEAAWDKLQSLAIDWNRNHVHQFSWPTRMFLQLRIPDSKHPELREILPALQKMRSELKVRVHAAAHRIYDDQDYREAAYVEVQGVCLDLPRRPFVLNQAEALGDPIPCPFCGWQDTFNVPQKAPFEIDESLLDQPLPGGEAPAGGWDCVALPAGHKLVSRRVLALFEEAHVGGYAALPVRVAGTGKESSTVFQFLSAKTILVPCPYHESSLSYCSTCGAVLDRFEDNPSDDSLFTPQSEAHFTREELAGSELLSRHPGLGAMLYLAQRPYRILMSAGLNGILANEVIRQCEHGSGPATHSAKS